MLMVLVAYIIAKQAMEVCYVIMQGIGCRVLHAVVYGLELAWDKCCNIILECDSVEVVKLLTSTVRGNCFQHPLLSSCHQLIAHPCTVEVCHIYREVNYVADGLALVGLAMPLGYQMLGAPPPEISTLLVRDILGSISKRFVMN